MRVIYWLCYVTVFFMGSINPHNAVAEEEFTPLEPKNWKPAETRLPGSDLLAAIQTRATLELIPIDICSKSVRTRSCLA